MLKDCKTTSFDRVCGQYLLSGAADQPLRLYHMDVTDPILEAATVEEMAEMIQQLEDDLDALRYDLRYPPKNLYGLYLKPEEGAKPEETA